MDLPTVKCVQRLPSSVACLRSVCHLRIQLVKKRAHPGQSPSLEFFVPLSLPMAATRDVFRKGDLVEVSRFLLRSLI